MTRLISPDQPPVTAAAYSSWRTVGFAAVGGPTGVFDASHGEDMGPFFPCAARSR